MKKTTLFLILTAIFFAVGCSEHATKIIPPYYPEASINGNKVEGVISLNSHREVKLNVALNNVKFSDKIVYNN